ncbi:MAG: orotate phosphoribosyltransferase [Fusobacteria bacterium]|nr:orotate phosphoribosyltransferase [Fusobacteriota bacterium]
MDFKNEVAKKLLEIKAVALSPNDPFTWASGIKSPIYCDNRLTLSYPMIRDLIATGLKSIIEEKFGNVKVLVGTATAGIPHAAWVAQKMNMPMAYVRSSAKDHGKNNQIEGIVNKGDNVVVIEDLISTGGSSLKVVEALKDAGANVLGLVAIFTYNFEDATNKFKESGVEFYTLSDYDTLVGVALESNYIKNADIETLREWRKNPRTYFETK